MRLSDSLLSTLFGRMRPRLDAFVTKCDVTIGCRVGLITLPTLGPKEYGDIILRPSEEIFTEDAARIAMCGSQYAWQFSECKNDKAPTEAEVKEEGPTKGVHPLTGEAYVQVDDEGRQAKKIG